MANGSTTQRVLIYGCGLIGTSFALALQQVSAEYTIWGIEADPAHRQIALQTGAFQDVMDGVTAALDEVHACGLTTSALGSFDLVVLATPVRVACAWLATARQLGSVIMDVCSVKSNVCKAARELGAEMEFAPTHPMAGKAIGGPTAATGDLFAGKPWLYISGWPAVEKVLPYIHATGAIPVAMSNERDHDEAMAIVSHGIHVTSLSAMLAYQKGMASTGLLLDHVTGPGFRDITRLASSPTEFWCETLLENRDAVATQIDRIIGELSTFKVALRENDDHALRRLLDAARDGYETWKAGNERANREC